VGIREVFMKSGFGQKMHDTMRVPISLLQAASVIVPGAAA